MIKRFWLPFGIQVAIWSFDKSFAAWHGKFSDKMLQMTWRIHDIPNSISYLMMICQTQHDEVEPNLKKIPHRNGIWGLEAIVM